MLRFTFERFLMNSNNALKQNLLAVFTCCFFTLYSGINSAKSTINHSLHPDAKKVLDVWLTAQLDYQQIPYMSVSYVKDQALVFNASYGHIEQNRIMPANNNTIASICSISKVFTATAIMKLVSQGKLNLDDKVIDLLPQLSVMPKDASLGDIKLIHLLNHTSGLPRDTLHSYWSGPKHHFPTKKELYASLANQHLESAVDKHSNYSNVGYALLGQIIEKASNTSYKKFIESEIFAPLNMNDSTVEMTLSNYGKSHALGYTATNRNGKRQQASFYTTQAMQSAAGISSNAHDLAKFAMWQFRELESINPELINADTLNAMYQTDHSPATKNRGFGYQIQTSQSGDIWAMHGGMCPGYNSFIQLNITQKQSFAVVTSANKVKAISYINNLKEILKRAALINDNAKTNSSLQEYAGFYDLNPWNSEYYVGAWGDELILLYLPVQSVKHAMYHYKQVGKDRFQLIKDGELTAETLTFKRNKEGNIVAINNNGNVHNKLKDL